MSDYPSAWIDDGYTENGYINGLARMWPPVKFAYRPTQADELSQYFDQTKNQSDARTRKIQAEWLKKRLLNWDIEKGPGRGIVQLTVENLLRIKPLLFNRMFDIVAGLQPSDEDPDELRETTEDDAKN